MDDGIILRRRTNTSKILGDRDWKWLSQHILTHFSAFHTCFCLALMMPIFWHFSFVAKMMQCAIVWFLRFLIVFTIFVFKNAVICTAKIFKIDNLIVSHNASFHKLSPSKTIYSMKFNIFIKDYEFSFWLRHEWKVVKFQNRS